MAGHTLKRRLWRWAPGAFVAAFALALALFGGPGYAEPDNVHAAVYQWAAEHPGENVPIILRTTGNSAKAGGTVTAFGGEVQGDFDFINAIQADVPATSLRHIAASSDIAFISLDAPVVSAHGGLIDDDKVKSMFPFAVDADAAWDDGVYGTGVGVAVIDTGISPSGHEDFKGRNGNSRVVAEVEVSSNTSSITDGYGHGTHIAGIVGGDGDLGYGDYVGVAPNANLVNVKIADDSGASSMGDLIAGIAWVYSHKAEYNIRVVNLSLHSTVAESYTTSPLDSAVEFLWKNGVFVVVASGNTGSGAGAMHFPPANDPFVMTVGATDDKGTKSPYDDVPATFSSGGFTQDGFRKPELLAPGVNIVSDTDTNSILYQQGLAAGKVVTPGPYLKLSGTSMSAGVMSGVAALAFEKRPNWTPGQLKCTLIAKARPLSWPNSTFSVPRARDTYNAGSNPSCNSDTGIAPSHAILGTPIVPLIGVVTSVLSQPDPYAAAGEIGLDITEANLVTTSPDDPTIALSIETVDWSAIKWDAIKWDLIKWDLIKWDLIKWDVIKWDLIKWDLIKWDLIKWDLIKWDLIKWDSIKWDLVKWDLIKWDLIKWDSIKWDAIKWDSIKWDAVKWDSLGFDSASGEFEDDPSDSSATDAVAAEESTSAETAVVDAPSEPASPPIDTSTTPPTS